MRSLALGLSFVLAGGYGCSPDPELIAESAETESRRPELVVLISIDTLRADHLGVYGHSRFTSPVLDEFAAEGTVFEDASAPAPWTLPSHASMLTGLYPLEHGVVTAKTALPDTVSTLAGMLKQEGFATAAVVNSTWLKQDTYRLTRDFDAYLAVDDADYGRRTPPIWVTDQAMQWVLDRRDAPLFLFVHYYDVHADYASLPAYENLFVTDYDGPADGTGWQLQVENFDDRHIAHCITDYQPEVCAFGSSDKPRVIGEGTEKVRFDAEDLRHLEELYDAGIRQLDTELGRFLEFLDERRLRDKSLVIITADHGEEFKDHGRVEHFLTQYQEMLRVPLILRGPGIPAGLRVDVPVSLVDIAPTVLALVDAQSKDRLLSGVDLSPLFRGEEAVGLSDRLIWGEASGGEGYTPPLDSIYPLYRSVRHGRYKLIMDVRTRRSELYDLEADPDETNDLSLSKRPLARRLETLLIARHAASNASVENREAVVLDPDEVDALRALGYMP